MDAPLEAPVPPSSSSPQSKVGVWVDRRLTLDDSCFLLRACLLLLWGEESPHLPRA